MKITTTFLSLLLTGLLSFSSPLQVVNAAEERAPKNEEAVKEQEKNPLASEADTLVAKIMEAGAEVRKLQAELVNLKGEVIFSARGAKAKKYMVNKTMQPGIYFLIIMGKKRISRKFMVY